jgi:hypothetical protein
MYDIGVIVIFFLLVSLSLVKGGSILFDKYRYTVLYILPQSTYFTVRGQSYFSRLPKY